MKKPIIVAKVCPEGGSVIVVDEVESGRMPTAFEPETRPDVFADGLIFIALANQPLSNMKDGTVVIPAGVSANITDELGHVLCRVEVHRNGSPPMYNIPGEFHPDTVSPLFHHIDGRSYIDALQVPDPFNSMAAIWCSAIEDVNQE